MDKLTTELMESIDKNLPQMVGDSLKARLVQADKDKEAADRVPRLTEELQRAQAAHRVLLSQSESVSTREKAVEARDQTVTLREQMCALKETHAKERVSEMRGVVQDVFANSKFKYTESNNTYTPQGSQGGSRTIESTVVPEGR